MWKVFSSWMEKKAMERLGGGGILATAALLFIHRKCLSRGAQNKAHWTTVTVRLLPVSTFFLPSG